MCLQDKRLGYHSEAIAFKYFPEKLRWRVNCLEKLLAEEFPAVEARIRAGETPLPYFWGLTGGKHCYRIDTDTMEEAPWEYFRRAAQERAK